MLQLFYFIKSEMLLSQSMCSENAENRDGPKFQNSPLDAKLSKYDTE